MKATHLEAFQRLAAQADSLMTLSGDFIIVEALPQEEAKTASGIILQSHDKMSNGFGQNLPAFYHVLMVGAGYYTQETDPETGAVIEKTVPLDVQPGDVVLLGTQSVKEFSKFGSIVSTKEAKIGLARAEEVQVRFHGPEAYAKVSAILGGAA
jgi:co-chaperonin GroES (HSP10)